MWCLGQVTVCYHSDRRWLSSALLSCVTIHTYYTFVYIVYILYKIIILQNKELMMMFYVQVCVTWALCFRSQSSALCCESRLCSLSSLWAKLDCDGHGTPLISNLFPESFTNLSLFSFRTETSSLMFLTFLVNIRPYKPPFAQTMVLTFSMPALSKQTVSLVYSINSRLAKATQRNPVPKNQNQNKNYSLYLYIQLSHRYLIL